jgi:hypothetical protein
VVRDAAQQVEQLVGRSWERPVGAVMGHARIVTEGGADRDGGGSLGGRRLWVCPHAELSCARAATRGRATPRLGPS